MAKEEGAILDVTFPAAEDLSTNQYRIVVLTSTGVRRPNDGAADRIAAIGVLQNAPASGYPAVVRLKGTSKVVLAEAVAVGEYIAAEYVDADDAGKGRDADVAKDIALGRCIMGGSEDELGEILLPGMTYQVGIAS